jgi:preprotein translocase subunit SecA
MNFGARKHVLEYDDVMNKQREVIYAERNAILDGKDIHARVQEMIEETVQAVVLEYCPDKVYAEEWDWETLARELGELTGDDLGSTGHSHDVSNPFELAGEFAERALERYQAKEDEVGTDNLRELERQVMLRVIDTRWMEHLLEMDYLKEGIGLRAVAQVDPLVAYKTEAYEMFGNLVAAINEDFLRTIFHIQLVWDEAPSFAPSPMSYTAPTEDSIFAGVAQAAAAGAVEGVSADQMAQASAMAGGGGHAAPVVKDKADPYADVGRNDLCPCGSGKKYKKCHGANA